jgi:hypothetical protein
MKRKILLPMVVLVLVSLACSTSVSNLFKPKTVENFDSGEKNWSEPFIVASQNPKAINIFVGKDVLKFELGAPETYVYKFRDAFKKADVVIETVAQNKGKTPVGMSLVCRAKEDMSEWIEFRVEQSGHYLLYFYNSALKLKEKNPYVSIKEGQSDAMYPIVPNTLKATCQGTTFSLAINGQDVMSIQDNSLADTGLVGIGVASSYNTPANIDFTKVVLSAP